MAKCTWQLHEGKEAAAEFQKILDHRIIVAKLPDRSSWRIWVLGPTPYAEIRGNKIAEKPAKAAYQDFLTLWKDADRDIEILKEAKAEYAKMQ